MSGANQKWRRLVTFALLVIGGAAFLWWRFGGDHEPSYQGHPLAFWVQQYVPCNTNLPFAVTLSDGGAAAVRQIGTNAVPTLLRWMRYPESNARMKLARWLQAKRPSLGADRFLVPGSYQPGNAILAIQALGTNAAGAIPELVHMLHRKDDARNAATALSVIGPDGMRAFAVALPTVEDGTLRANVLLNFLLAQSAELQRELAPILAQRLRDDSAAVVRMSAAEVLSCFTNLPATAVPALAGAVRDRDGGVRLVATDGLGRFGREAISAVPALEAALTDQNPQVRANATNALLLIQGR